MNTVSVILGLLVGLIGGLIPAVLLFLRRGKGDDGALSGALNERLSLREQRITELESELSSLRARLEQESLGRATAETNLSAERDSSAEKLHLLNEAREALSNQFKALAGEILEEKSKRFAEQNQESLGTLLNPLKEQIGDFKKKVEEVLRPGGTRKGGTQDPGGDARQTQPDHQRGCQESHLRPPGIQQDAGQLRRARP